MSSKLLDRRVGRSGGTVREYAAFLWAIAVLILLMLATHGHRMMFIPVIVLLIVPIARFCRLFVRGNRSTAK